MKIKIVLVSVIILFITGFFYFTNALQAEDKLSSEKNLIPEPDLKNWPEASQIAAKEMIDKYGKPNESTSEMLIWNNNGIWMQTIVYRKEMKHNFPKPHSDVLEQWINYRVPPSKYTELTQFDGSITANRTNGTISARSDKEAMNILTLNLVYTIINESKDVEKARTEYTRNAVAFEKGEMTYYTYKLNFFNDASAPDADKPFNLTESIILGSK
ncbi:MAG TPA: hypothetical protein VNZ49_15135 [Bacteroidia bacterium]|jgi:hypothetical protein|nr:hypothetical protein [Bacteroidia bacterium]